MEHADVSLSNEQSPSYKEFLHTLIEENKEIQDDSSYELDISNSANLFFKQVFSWDYFSNELEFE